MIDVNVRSVHWSFWMISAAGLLFNLMGCVNFVSQMDVDTVATLPETYRTLVETRPPWATGAFAVAVFGGAIAALLLLFRKSAAYYVFILSLLGTGVAQIPAFSLADLPVGALIGGLSQLLVTMMLVWYAGRARRKGWIN